MYLLILCNCLKHMQCAEGRGLSSCTSAKIRASGKRWSVETKVRKQKYGNRSTETEVRKPKYGSGKKSPLPVSSALLTYVRLCLVDKGWLSQSDVRRKYWHIGLQQALTQSFSMTQWVYSCRSLIPRLRWPFASVSGVVLLLVNWAIGEELWQYSHLHHCHWEDYPGA